MLVRVGWVRARLCEADAARCGAARRGGLRVIQMNGKNHP